MHEASEDLKKSFLFIRGETLEKGAVNEIYGACQNSDKSVEGSEWICEPH